MATKQIKELTEANKVNDDDILLIQDTTGANKKVTKINLLKEINQEQANTNQNIKTITENISDLSESNKTIIDTIGNEDMGTDSNTLKGAIGEHSKAIDKNYNYQEEINKLPSSLNFKFKNFINSSINDKHMQGMCYVKKDDCLLIAYSDIDTSVLAGKIIKYSLQTNSIVSTYTDIEIGHANDMTYREDTDEVYITSIYSSAGQNSITIFNYSDMQKKQYKVFSEISSNFSVIGIDIDENNNIVVLTIKEIYIYDKDFNFIKKFNNDLMINDTQYYTVQGMALKGRLLFVSAMECLKVYNIDTGELLKTFQVSRVGETEGIAIVNDDIIIGNIIPNVEEKYTTTRLFTINLKQQYDNYEWHIYNSMEEIGLVEGQETIEKICKYLPSKSMLIFPVVGTNLSGIYPSVNGICEVKKINNIKIRLNFYDTLSEKTWTSSFNNDLSNKYSGWSLLNNIDSGWKNLDFLNGTSSTTGFECKYRKVDKLTQFTGLIKGITPESNVIASIPIGFRINSVGMFLLPKSTNDGHFIKVGVTPDGALLFKGCSTTITSDMAFSLSGISYFVD